jgi:FkbM family methyltransferase
LQILRYLLKSGMLNSEPTTVLDVGARSADIGRWKAFGRNLRYLGFEADEEECRRLNCSVTRNNVAWEERYFPTALSREHGKKRFYITEKPECSSLLEPNVQSLDGFSFADHLAIKRTKFVTTYNLSHCVNLYSIPTTDFIKLDVQGAELDILQGGRKLVDSALGLEVEVEFVEVYKNQPLFGEIDAWVRSKGFILFDISRVYNKRLTLGEDVESHGQLTWGDALYLKDVNHLFKGSRGTKCCTAKLFKLAAIADLYRRPDYSLHVLERAVEKFPDYLRDDLGAVESAISGIRSHLAGTNQLKDRPLDGLFERQLNTRLGNYFPKLFLRIFRGLKAKMEARKRGYCWREQSW